MRPTTIERAGLYLSKTPPAVQGQDGSTVTFKAAMTLIKGFNLTLEEAWPIMKRWNETCQPPWNDKDLHRKLQQARDCVGGAAGYLLGDDEGEHGKTEHVPDTPAPRMAPPKPEFQLETLKRFAGDLEGKIDLIWLANRSALDPALVDAQTFLSSLYGRSEMVLIFTDQMTQGQAVWPDDKLPTGGREGVWFLAQPVDGQYHPNPRSLDKKTGEARNSRRSEESVTAWRYMVIESDEAPLNLWLAALVKLPLRIVAVYSSGGRSIHALVQVDCFTKSQWDAEKRAMAPGLIMLGADPGAMSAVRLTRLPGCYREEKKSMQKLLYIQPKALLRPLWEATVLRDVEAYWMAQAADGVADSDDGSWLKSGLSYYAKRSPRLKDALTALLDGRVKQ